MHGPSISVGKDLGVYQLSHNARTVHVALLVKFPLHFYVYVYIYIHMHSYLCVSCACLSFSHMCIPSVSTYTYQ